jgi:hypothetical protein
MLKLQETNERINANAGLSAIGLLLQDISLGNRECHGNGISDHDVLMSMTGLLCQGQVHYEDVENYRQDPAFSAMLGLSRIPSSSLLCQRINHLGYDAASHARLEAANSTLLLHQSMGACRIGGGEYVPLDIDVSPMDNGGSNREHVGRTYKGCDGFAPIFAYIGTEGWLLHHELRPGIQHCQKDTPAFIEDCFDQLKSLSLTHPVCVRLDSGNDSADTLAVLRTSKHHFIVKRNLRLEDKAQWLETARSLGDPSTPRLGKDVYTGTVDHLVPGGNNSHQETLTVVYRVVHRTIDKHGQHLLIPTIEVETYWTNLWRSEERHSPSFCKAWVAPHLHACWSLSRAPGQQHRPGSSGLILATLTPAGPAHATLVSRHCATCGSHRAIFGGRLRCCATSPGPPRGSSPPAAGAGPYPPTPAQRSRRRRD